jgi:hypothetical protein
MFEYLLNIFKKPVNESVNDIKEVQQRVNDLETYFKDNFSEDYFKPPVSNDEQWERSKQLAAEYRNSCMNRVDL